MLSFEHEKRFITSGPGFLVRGLFATNQINSNLFIACWFYTMLWYINGE